MQSASALATSSDIYVGTHAFDSINPGEVLRLLDEVLSSLDTVNEAILALQQDVAETEKRAEKARCCILGRRISLSPNGQPQNQLSLSYLSMDKYV
jgi:hypothetical protein